MKITRANQTLMGWQTCLSIIVLLGLLLPNIALAASKYEEDLEQKQEALKANASTWRETTTTPENPSTLQLRAVFPDKEWWLQFNDDYLTAYIQEAFNANHQLAIAEERIKEARALARQSLGQEFPQLSIGAAFTRQRNSATIIPQIRSSGGGTSQSGGAQNAAGNVGGGFGLGTYLNFYSVPLTMNYEVDPWLKNRDRTRAANKQADASEINYATARIILATDVANAYFNLMAADKLIVLQQEYIQTGGEDLAHSQRLFEAGITSEEEVVIKEQILTEFKAQLQEFYRVQALTINQLAVMLGRTTAQATDMPRADWEKYQIPDAVESGLPAELIVRRPDIVSAENQLMASGILVRAARKEFFPTLNLTGQFGFATVTPSRLFDWDSYLASIAASLAQTLFTGGQKRANLRVFKARYGQQLHTYQQMVLQAFQEVDDSLASLKAHRNAYQDYSKSLESFDARLQYANNRLEAGAIAEAELTPIKLQMILSEEGLVNSKLAAMVDTLSLYKALGGGY